MHVIRHKKTKLMCTKHAPLHYLTYFANCTRYTSFVNCIRFPIVNCTSSINIICKLCLDEKLQS